MISSNFKSNLYLFFISFLIYLFSTSSFYIQKKEWLSVFCFIVLTLILLKLKKEFELNNLKKLLLISIPFIFTLLYEYKEIGIYNHFSNPILYITIYLIIHLWFIKNSLSITSILVSSIIIVVYSFLILGYWHQNQPQVKEQEKPTILNSNLYQKLDDFYFMNTKKQKIHINSDKNYVFIQTTNPTCMPCRIAYYDLKNLLKSKENRLDYYYIYVKTSLQNFNKIINDGYINDENKILYDFTNELYTSYKMTLYPEFLIYKNNKLVERIKGYNQNEILKILDTIN